MTEEAFPSASYVTMVQHMTFALRKWIELGEKPAFALPPKEIGIIAPLEGQLAGCIARNGSARAFLTFCGQIGKRVQKELGGDGTVTVMMLAIVLEQCGVEPERVALEDLGLDVGTS